MKTRKVDQYLMAYPTQDGAGVKMRRLFWRKDTMDMDPFLMLDMFDSKNKEDYIKGFPLHPHRGIQTLTYFIKGKVNHLDSLGNRGTIGDGEFQWMNAGGGILHEEMPQEVPHMLGFQLWINLPKEHKMSPPDYYSGTKDNIQVVKEDDHIVRILSGVYKDSKPTVMQGYIPTQIFDIEIKANSKINIPVDKTYNSLVAVMQGELTVCDKFMEEKAGATFKNGNIVTFKTGDKFARVMLFAGKELNEPIAWGGPIVMNTQEELNQARIDLQNGKFVAHDINIKNL